MTKASNAKIETAVGAVKEALKLEQGEKVINNEKLTPEILLSEGKVTRTVQQGEEEKYYMYYAIKENAYEGMQGLGKGNIASLKDVFLIDDKLNVKYIASNGKEYGDNLENKVLEDETEIRFASKAFSKYVSNISGVTEDEMKFKWMKNQTELTISDPQVDSLQDLVFFPNLNKLTIGESKTNSPQITTLDGIENCTKLTSISIIFGPNKDYTALTFLPSLSDFYRSNGNDYNNIIDTLKLCSKIEAISITNCQLEDMSRISEIGNLKSLKLNYNLITNIEGLENKSSLENIELEGNKITKIEGLQNLYNLKSLILNGNKITRIEGLENLNKLTSLYLANNQITDITPLSANTSLTFLDLRKNDEIDGDRNNYTGEKLEALNRIGEILDRNGTINIDIDKIGLFTNYKRLSLPGQNISTLEALEGLTELEYLELNNNQLTLEDEKSQGILKSMTNLKTLTLTNNKITDITAINSLTNLETLYLIGTENKVNLVEIEDIISNLNNLRVSTESLKTILNCDITKITRLMLNSSGLTEIPDLSRLTSLKEIDLSSNPSIENISNISKLVNLQKINLTYNNLHGRMIDFSNLTNLESLNLSRCSLWDEDLENLKALKNNTDLTIDLSNNSIINATALLELNSNVNIRLSGNVNLTQEAKEELKRHFQDRVKF